MPPFLPDQQLMFLKRDILHSIVNTTLFDSAVYDSLLCLFSILRQRLVRMGYFGPELDWHRGLNGPEGKQDMSRP